MINKQLKLEGEIQNSSTFKRLKSVKAKFPKGQCKSLKQILCIFEGHCDLEGPGQSNKFLI